MKTRTTAFGLSILFVVFVVFVLLPSAAIDARAEGPTTTSPPPPPAQPKIQWHRDAKDPRWVQGEVTVDATPDAVFARVERVGVWPQFLSDVLRVKVLEHPPGGSHWKIELETRTLGHGMLGYDVDVGPGRTLKLYTNRLGVKAVAQTLVRPAGGASQTNVVYSFFIELSGLPSLLISEKELHEKQEHMVAVTLADVAKAFPTKPPAAPPPAPPPPATP
jgi:hypothetical protein